MLKPLAIAFAAALAVGCGGGGGGGGSDDPKDDETMEGGGGGGSDDTTDDDTADGGGGGGGSDDTTDDDTADGGDGGGGSDDTTDDDTTDSGGGGDTALTSEEQVALAAFGSSDSLSSAETATSEAEEDDSTSASTSASGPATFASSTRVGCDEGVQYVHEDSGGPFALDQVDFAATGVFDDNSKLPTGSDTQIRADDCRNEETDTDGNVIFSSRTDGISDTAQADNLGGTTGEGSIQYLVSGGYDGSDTSTPSVDDRDLSEPFILETESDFGNFSLSFRGEFWACGACLEATDGDFVADLSNFGGDPERDVAVAGRMEIVSDNLTIKIGETDSIGSNTVESGDVWTFVARGTGSDNSSEFVIDGRYALTDDDKPECNFDVTYDSNKSNPLEVEDFSNDTAIPVAGKVTMTDNDGGEEFDVDFDTGNPDTVEVNGKEYNRNDLTDDTDCSTGIEESSES